MSDGSSDAFFDQALTRQRLLGGAVKAGAAAAFGGALFGSAGSAYARSFMVVSSSPINKIFGPGGKQAGQGYTHHHGLTHAITGAGAAFGVIATRATKLAIQQIKDAGGPNIRQSIVDHKTGVVEAQVSGVRRIISQDDITTLESSWLATTLATLPLVQQHHVLTFNGGGPSSQQLNKDYLWLPGVMYGTDPLGGMLAWLAKNGAKNISVVGDLPSGVVDFGKQAKKLWPTIQKGGKVLSVETFNSGLTDFGSIVARVKAVKPDAIVTDSLGTDLGNIVKQFREGGIKQPIMGVIFDSQAAKLAGKWIDSYHFATGHYDPGAKNPFNQQFVAAHKKAYGVEPEYYGGIYYENIFIVWELIRRVIKNGGNPSDGKQLQQALEQNPSFYTVFGGSPSKIARISFNKDHSANLPMGVFAVKNGKPVKLQAITKTAPYLA